MTTTPTINIFEDKTALSAHFAEMFAAQVKQTPDNDKYTVLLSGGSTPKAIYQYLAQHYADTINWKKVLFFWGDERMVPPDHSESNYRMAKESLFDHISIPENNIFRIQGENSVENEVVAYNDLLKKNVKHENGNPCFNLVLLGLGVDGHTASIFPDQIALYNSSNYCEPARNPYSGQQRISVTGRVINEAKQVCFLVTGKNKAQKVYQILHKTAEWEKLPASLVKAKNGSIFWFLDKEAGQLL